MKNFIEESDEHEEIIKTVKPDCRREIPECIPQIERHEVSHVAFPGMAQPGGGDQGAGQVKSCADDPAESHDVGKVAPLHVREMMIAVDQVFEDGECQAAECSGKRELPCEPQEPRPFFQQVNQPDLFEELLHERREKEDVQDYEPGTFRTEKCPDHCNDSAEESCKNGRWNDFEHRMVGKEILEPEFIIRVPGVITDTSW